MDKIEAPVQDFAPKGMPTIKYARNLPRRGPSGAVVLTAIFAMMTYGFIKVGEGNNERRELRREKMWARIHLVPLLTAENDRDMVRRSDIVKEREEATMQSDTWKGGDLKARVPGLGPNGVLDPTANEPVYFTERFVMPSLVLLQKKDKVDAQVWRGSTVLTKNPPYHERSDFTEETPIGK